MRLFFVCNIASDFKSFVPTIRFFLDGGHDVSVYLARRIGAYSGCGQFLDEITAAGGRLISHDGSDDKQMIPAMLPKGKKPFGLPVSGNLLKNMSKLLRIRQFYQQMLFTYAPDIVFLSQEDIHYLSPIIVSQARQIGGGTLVLPFVIDNPEGAAEEFSKKSDYLVRSVVSKMIAWRYPDWVMEYKGKKVFHVPPMTILALELLGMAPIAPWSNACSFSDAVVVEGKALRSKNPHACSKSRVIGSLVMDAMHKIRTNVEVMKAELLHELGLDPTRPILLCALPPDQFNTNRHDLEFGSYAELIKFCLSSLAASGWQVVVNLHPRTDPAEIRQSGYDSIKVSDRPIWHLISLCDAYVSFTSATIRWAIACGTPVINYDVYRYYFDDYRSVPSVVHVDSRQDFANCLSRMADDYQYFEELKALQAGCASDWGCMDGRSHERLLALCEEVRAKYPPAHS